MIASSHGSEPAEELCRCATSTLRVQGWWSGSVSAGSYRRGLFGLSRYSRGCALLRTG